MTGITIERDAHSQQYVIVHNRVARDKRLRRDARGLLVELLSLRAGERVTSESLTEDGREGRDAIRRMLRDLEACGYIERRKTQDERGRWSTRLIVHETPVSSETELIPETENQSSVPPAKTPHSRRSDRRLKNRPSVDQALKTKDQHQKTKDGEPSLRSVPPPRRAPRAPRGDDGPTGAQTPRRYARARGTA